MNPQVSIITPSYNSEKFICETIEGIRSQTYKNWELLITDDCSSDGTWNILKKYVEQDERIKIFQLESNSGGGIARNHSIEKANGKFIAFCDSDDVWTPDKLAKQVKFMLDNNYEFTFTGLQHMDENGEILQTLKVPERVAYKDLLKKNWIGCLTVMIDIEKLGKVFLPSIRKRQDYCLWLSILKRIDYAYGYDEVLAKYRERKDSLSRSKVKLVKYNWEVLRSHEKISIASSFYYICTMIFHTIKKYYLRK